MRIALAGKGGAGKTTISATLSRLWARSGAEVCAIDGDSNPNLGAALGLGGAARSALTSLPTSIVSRRLDGGPALSISLDEVLLRHAATCPDGVRLLVMGAPAHAEEGCMCSAHATVAAVLADLGDRQAITIMDLEASPEHFSRGTARHADVLLLITEPYWRSMETTRRMAALARELPIGTIAVVGNKLRGQEDRDALASFATSHELPVLAAIPRSESVLDADVAEQALLDMADADDVVVTAVERLRGRLVGVQERT